VNLQRLGESRTLTPWPWLVTAGGLGAVTFWLISRTATRTAEYHFGTFTTSGELVSSSGPFDTLLVVCLIAAVTAVVLSILAVPGWVISSLFAERLSQRYSPAMTRWLIVPAATVLFWMLVLAIASMAGCATNGRVFLGSMSLPLSLYEGSSQPVHLTFQQDVTRSRLDEALKASTIDETTRIELLVPGDLRAVSLQVELQAPDVMIGGDAKQSQGLDVPRLQYDWTLNFNSAGRKVLSFVFRLADKKGKLTAVGHIDREVEVTKLGFLSKPQAAGLATASAVLGLLSLLIGLIKPVAQRLIPRKKTTKVTGFSPPAGSDAPG
jgi:hypothetical protein